MSETEIRDTVFTHLRKIAPDADLNHIRADENLREALDIDSFDFLNLLIGLHEQLKIEIPESDYSKLSTLGELVNYLSDRVK